MEDQVEEDYKEEDQVVEDPEGTGMYEGSGRGGLRGRGPRSGGSRIEGEGLYGGSGRGGLQGRGSGSGGSRITGIYGGS